MAARSLSCALPFRRRRLSWPGASWLIAGAIALIPVVQAGPAKAGLYRPGQIQLEIEPEARIADINAEYGTASIDSLPPLHLLSCEVGTELMTVMQMSGDPRIVFVEQSYNNNTPEAVRQMVVAAVGGTIEDYLDQNMVLRLHLAEIQEHTNGAGVTVAVLDTGVLPSHPALEGCLRADGYDFIDMDDTPVDTANGVDDDHDDVVDEGAGHGTMVAGLVHLVAPESSILPIRILDDEGNGISFDVARGIRYAREHGAHVINMSLGLQVGCHIIDYEIRTAYEAGITMVAPSGNGGMESALYPAIDPRVLMVSGLDSMDVKAEFSNYHELVDVSAPGKGILAPYYDGEYAIGAGTSFSAPIISGQGALIRSYNPNLARDEIDTAIRAGVVEVDGINGNWPYQGKLGTGRMDGLVTLSYLGSSSAAPDRGLFAGGSSPRSSLIISPNPVRSGQLVRFAVRHRPLNSGFTGGGASPGGALRIVAASGRIVAEVPLTPKGSTGAPAGPLQVTWDGRDGSGRLLPAGSYLAAADGGGARRFVIVR